MATSQTSTSPIFTPVSPGQAFLGSKVEASPFITAGKAVAAGGLAVGGNLPTVTLAAGSGTGAAAAITGLTGYDQAASFSLVAGVGAIQGGTLATVVFGTPLNAAPASVVVNMYSSAGTVGIAVGAFALSKTGFSIGGPAPVSGGTYSVNWVMLRTPQS